MAFLLAIEGIVDAYHVQFMDYAKVKSLAEELAKELKDSKGSRRKNSRMRIK